MRIEGAIILFSAAVLTLGGITVGFPSPGTTCVGKCFEERTTGTESTCFCDAKCSKEETCCSDYTQECANASLCENRCGIGHDRSLPCQCNTLCAKFRNCCPDFQEKCLAGSCSGRCGARDSDESCQCDGECLSSFDCCSDFIDTCNKKDSCALACGTPFDGDRTCQCHGTCEVDGNCCDDFSKECQTDYLCQGDCGVERLGCSCMETCEESGRCCTDYQQSCKGDSAWVTDDCTPDEEMMCPDGFDKAPVILFGIDGMRSDYLYRGLTPNIMKLASCGVHTPHVRSVYPTLTFPNFYSIATGLYPESHGIVGNEFHDYDIDNEFDMGAPEGTSHRLWWGGEPIWVTAGNQGLKTASYFWIGSDQNVTRYPDYYYVFSSKVPDQEKVYQVLKWLDMPVEKRPSFITIYIFKVDSIGHRHGPNGPNIDAAIRDADRIVGMLMDGLKARKLDKCANLMLTADHGMSDIHFDKVKFLSQENLDIDKLYYSSGAVSTIGKSADKSLHDQFDPENIMDKLQCRHDETLFKAFMKQKYLPKRLHFADSDRIGDVVLLLDDHIVVRGKPPVSYFMAATHGWDPQYVKMRGMFVAHGPSFRRSYNTTESFDNVELYNMMCELLDITPAPNNGTLGGLSHMLRDPRFPRIQDAGELPIVDLPPNLDTHQDIRCPHCEINEDSDLIFQMTDVEAEESREKNMPMGFFGMKRTSDDEPTEYAILTQKDYVNAFNLKTKLSNYVSFVMETKDRNMSNVGSSCLRPDIRLTAEHSMTCLDLQESGIAEGIYLHDSAFSKDHKTDSELLTNVVPVYRQFMPIWKQLLKVLDAWSIMYNGIAVVAGPVFDYDYNGVADTMEVLRNYGHFVGSRDTFSAPIPTHIFVSVFRCKNYLEESVDDCSDSPNNIEVFSVVIPNFMEQPCDKDDLSLEDWFSKTVYIHVARIRDIELLTGISFFDSWLSSSETSMDVKINALRLKLHLPQFETSWMDDFMGSVKPDEKTRKALSWATKYGMPALAAVIITLILVAANLQLTKFSGN